MQVYQVLVEPAGVYWWNSGRQVVEGEGRCSSLLVPTLVQGLVVVVHPPELLLH